MKRLLLLPALASASLFAQASSDVIIDRVQQGTPPPAPTAASIEKPAETGDLDGGTQRVAETRTRPFKLTLAYDVQAYYTSNVLLQPKDSPSSNSDAVVVANTLLARIEGNSLAVGDTLLTPSGSFVYQRYNHAIGSNDAVRKDLDFDVYSVPFALRLRTGDNWELGLGVTGTSVYSTESAAGYHLTYQSLATSLSARKQVSVGRNQLLSLGGAVSYARTWADTDDIPGGLVAYRDDRNDKIDTSFDAGYYYLKDRWVVGPFLRLVYSDYLHYEEADVGAARSLDRRDLSGSVGVSVSYNLTPWAIARVFSSYDWRDARQNGSSVAGDDFTYRSTSAGLGLSLNASF